jgi:hypothetical protein
MLVFNKKIKDKNSAGFSLVEAMLAVTIFALIVSMFTEAIISGQEASVLSGDRGRAINIAEEGIEAVRNIGESDFSNLIDGTYGLATSSNEWVLSGSSDVTGVFTRAIEIDTVDSDRKEVTSSVSWQQNAQRLETVSLVTYLSYWRAVSEAAQSLTISTTSAAIGGAGNKELQGITIQNTGDADITIDKITVTWSNGQDIEEIDIDGSDAWKHNGAGDPAGRQPTGTELDIVDQVLVSGGAALDMDKIKFDGDMTGDTFTITFTMSDATTKQTTVDLSGGGGGPTCGTHADDATLDTSAASVGGAGNKELLGVTLEAADASCDITLAKVTLTWTNGQDVEEIKIDGSRIWKHNNEGDPNGRQPTGTEIDVVDYLVSGGTTSSFDKFKFNGNMTGDTFTITLEYSDGSTDVSSSFSP